MWVQDWRGARLSGSPGVEIKTNHLQADQWSGVCVGVGEVHGAGTGRITPLGTPFVLPQWVDWLCP